MPVPVLNQANLDKITQKIFYPETEADAALFKDICRRFNKGERSTAAVLYDRSALADSLRVNKELLDKTLKDIDIPQEEKDEIVQFIAKYVYIHTNQPHDVHKTTRYWGDSHYNYSEDVFRSDFLQKSLSGNIGNFNSARDDESITFPAFAHKSHEISNDDLADLHKKYPTSKILSNTYTRSIPYYESSKKYKGTDFFERSDAVNCAFAIDKVRRVKALIKAMETFNDKKELSRLFDAVTQVNGLSEKESITANNIAAKNEIAKEADEKLKFLQSMFPASTIEADRAKIDDALAFADTWSKKIEHAFETLKGASEDKFKNKEFESLSEGDVIDFFTKTQNAKLFDASLDVLRAPDFIKKCNKAKETLEFIKNSRADGKLPEAIHIFKEQRNAAKIFKNYMEASIADLEIDSKLDHLKKINNKDEFFSINGINAKIAEIDSLSNTISDLGINLSDEKEKRAELEKARLRIDEINAELNVFLKSFLDRSSDKLRDKEPESLTSDQIASVLSEDLNPEAFAGAQVTKEHLKTLSTASKCESVMGMLNNHNGDGATKPIFSWGQDLNSKRYSKIKAYGRDIVDNISLDVQQDDEKFQKAAAWINKSNRKLVSSLTSFVRDSHEDFKSDEYVRRIPELSGDEILNGILNPERNPSLFGVLARYGVDIFGEKVIERLLPTSSSKHLIAGVATGQSSFLSGDSASGKTESLKVAHKKIIASLGKMDKKDADIMDSQADDAKKRVEAIEELKAKVESIKATQAERKAERDKKLAEEAAAAEADNLDGEHKDDKPKASQDGAKVGGGESDVVASGAGASGAEGGEMTEAEAAKKMEAEALLKTEEAESVEIKELEEKIASLTKEHQETLERERDEWSSKGVVDGKLKPRELKLISIDHRTTDADLERYYEELRASKATMNGKRDVISVFVDESDLILEKSKIELVRNKIMKFCKENQICVVKSTASIPLPELVNDCQEYATQIKEFVGSHPDLPESVKQAWGTMSTIPPVHTLSSNHLTSKVMPNEEEIDFSRLRTCGDEEFIAIVSSSNKAMAQAAREMIHVRNVVRETMDAVNDLKSDNPAEKNKIAFACSELFTESSYFLKKRLEQVLSRGSVKKIARNIDNPLLPAGSGLSEKDVPVFSILNAENKQYKGFDEVREIIEEDRRNRNASESAPLSIQQLFSDDDIKQHFGSARDIREFLSSSLQRIQESQSLESKFKDLHGDSNQVYNLVVTDELGKKHPYNISVSVNSRGKISISVTDIARTSGDNFYLGRNNTIFVTSNKRESYISQDPVTNVLVNCPDPQNQQNGRNRRFQKVSIMVSDEDKIAEEIGYEAFLMNRFHGHKPDLAVDETVEDLCDALGISASGSRYNKILGYAKHFVSINGGAELYIDGYLGEALSKSKEIVQREEASFQSSVQSCETSIENARKHMYKNTESFLAAQKHLKACKAISAEIAELRSDYENGRSVYNAMSLKREIDIKDKARRTALNNSIQNIGVFMRESDREIVREVESIYQEALINDSRMPGQSLPFEIFKLNHNLVALKQVDDLSKRLLEQLQMTPNEGESDLINHKLQNMSSKKKALFELMAQNKNDYIKQTKENENTRILVANCSEVCEKGLREDVSSPELHALNSNLIKIRVLMEEEKACNIDTAKRIKSITEQKKGQLSIEYTDRLNALRQSIKDIAVKLPELSKELSSRMQEEKEIENWVEEAKMRLSGVVKASSLDNESVRSRNTMIENCKHNIEQVIRATNNIYEYGTECKSHIDKAGSVDADYKFIEKQAVEAKNESENRSASRQSFEREIGRLSKSIESLGIEYNPREPEIAGIVSGSIVRHVAPDKFIDRKSNVAADCKFENLQMRKTPDAPDIANVETEQDLTDEERFNLFNMFTRELLDKFKTKLKAEMDSGAIKQRSEEYIKLKRSFLEDTKSIRSGNVNDDKIESFVETMVPKHIDNIMEFLGDNQVMLDNFFDSLNQDAWNKLRDAISATAKNESLSAESKDNFIEFAKAYNKNAELYELTHNHNFDESACIPLFSMDGELKKRENNPKLLTDALSDINDLNTFALKNNRRILDSDLWRGLKDDSTEANLARVALKAYRAAAMDSSKGEEAAYLKSYLEDLSAIAKTSFIHNMEHAEMKRGGMEGESSSSYIESKDWFDLMDMIDRVSAVIEHDVAVGNFNSSTPEDLNCLAFVENKMIGKQTILNSPHQAMACDIYIAKDIKRELVSIDKNEKHNEDMTLALNDKRDGAALNNAIMSFEKFKNQNIDLKAQEPLRPEQIEQLKNSLQRIEFIDARTELSENMDSSKMLSAGDLRKLNEIEEEVEMSEEVYPKSIDSDDAKSNFEEDVGVFTKANTAQKQEIATPIDEVAPATVTAPAAHSYVASHQQRQALPTMRTGGTHAETEKMKRFNDKGMGNPISVY